MRGCGACGDRPRKAGDEVVGADRGVLIVIEEPFECAAARVGGVAVSERASVQPQQVVHPVATGDMLY